MIRISSLFILLCWLNPIHAQRVIILVRHAEKEGGTGDVALTTAGRNRAAQLAQALADAGVDAVFTTPYQRTSQTAQPLAERIKITPSVLDVREKADTFVKRLHQEHPEGVVVIVGHSNTIPMLVDVILRRRSGISIADDEFDKIFVLTAKKDGSWSLIRTRY